MGTGWRDSQIRYLVHFSDGGAGRRFRDEPLEVGAELMEGRRRYRVVRVEQPPSPRRLGRAWAELATPSDAGARPTE